MELTGVVNGRGATRRAWREAAVTLSLCLALGISCGSDGGTSPPGGADPCGNAAGNASQPISGPPAPSGADFDQVFRSLVVHPANADIVYVGTERNGIVRSVDGGRSWERLRSGMRHASGGYPEVWDIAISPANPSLVVAGTVDSPGPATGDYPSSIAGVYRSSDGGVTWMRANCGLTNSSVASVAFDRRNPATAVIGTNAGRASFSGLAGQFFAGGLLRSTDEGRTWASVTPSGGERGSHWQILYGITSASSFMLSYSLDPEIPTQSRGFLRSTDAGATWTSLPNALAGRNIAAIAASADGRIIYAAERNPFRLYRSADGGTTWAVIAAPGTEPLAVSPADDRIILLAGSPGVYRSDNSATSWRLVLPSSRRFDDFEFAPSDARVVYAATEGYDVFRSDDAGATWRLLVNLRASVLR
ncbi:MAG: WD40/YVTN/BNR-like repeat-containing protein [Gemmatimonadaceae bacterium]